MGYTEEHFRHLTDTYGRYGGWAIWDYGKQRHEERSTACIYKSLHLLHARYVVVGLNVSARIPVDWENFRGGRHDRKMKYAFNDNLMKGCYITDIFKGIEEASSIKLFKHLEENPHIIPGHVELFRQEMEDIGASENTVFVILGPETSGVAQYFAKHFYPHFPNNKVLFYYHYSGRGTDRKWVENVWSLLGINEDFDSMISKYS